MVLKEKKSSCCDPQDQAMSCCKVESIISVDDRGQILLPKDIRDKARIKFGDKLAVVIWESPGKACCISLIKAEHLAGTVKGIIGPMIEGTDTNDSGR
ncbi:MAG: HgcAB-associated protein [Candidatus Bathyarchaeia archaeon]|jgi:AbrB family looped-hinge helix DNA binding protein